VNRPSTKRDASGAPAARYEILPFGPLDTPATKVPASLALTVTCSPKHGAERSIALAARMRELGHVTAVHVAARTVRDRAHLDALLAASTAAGIEDWFVIGGDGNRPAGEFSSAVELLPLVASHPQRPARLGIAGYPEGHPLIDDATLDAALDAKSPLADYLVTQLCFDATALRGWIAAQRARGLALPIWLGVPGQVSAARLLEVSLRVGVGPSLRFVRKQRGLGNLFGLLGGAHRSRTTRLARALGALASDHELGIAGLHYFTFNQLAATWRWQQALSAPDDARRPAPARARGLHSRLSRQA
jgi:methylenetetrahydrofolate reductase (NADPH)